MSGSACPSAPSGHQRFGLAEAVRPGVVAEAMAAIAAELSTARRSTDADRIVAMGGAVTNLAAVERRVSDVRSDVVQGTILDRAEIIDDRPLSQQRHGPDRRSIIGSDGAVPRSSSRRRLHRPDDHGQLGRDSVTVSDRWPPARTCSSTASAQAQRSSRARLTVPAAPTRPLCIRPHASERIMAGQGPGRRRGSTARSELTARCTSRPRVLSVASPDGLADLDRQREQRGEADADQPSGGRRAGGEQALLKGRSWVPRNTMPSGTLRSRRTSGSAA